MNIDREIVQQMHLLLTFLIILLSKINSQLRAFFKSNPTCSNFEKCIKHPSKCPRNPVTFSLNDSAIERSGFNSL